MESRGALYFFEQTHFRKTHKRCKKAPEDLPHDLRYAHLNPRVAAYLANKDKEAKEGQGGATFITDGLGNKSLLPQITEKVSFLRQKLDDFLSDDGEAQRRLFEEAKVTCIGLLEELALYLYSFDVVPPRIPRSLETQLLASFKELTANVYVAYREWQLPSNREEHLQKQFQNSHSESSRDLRSERSDYPASVGSTSVAMTEDMDELKLQLSARSTRETEAKSRGRSSKSVARKSSNLGDIPEARDEDTRSQRGRSASRDLKAGLAAARRESREQQFSLKPKIKLDTDRPPSEGQLNAAVPLCLNSSRLSFRLFFFLPS